MMNSNLTFPVRHISVRVPWHDNGWDGTVCLDPKRNTACLKLRRISEGKDEELEANLAGRLFKDLRQEYLPPCVYESASIMSPHGLTRMREHPYRQGSKDTHGHFKPTPMLYRAYSAAALPFRWMMKKEVHPNGRPGLSDYYPLEEVNPELEPNLGFNTGWWQDYRNQTALLETFWAHVKPEGSLVFFYAKQVPLIEDVAGQRILIGVGRVKSIGPLTEYLYDGHTEGKLRSMLWERMTEHSIRPDFEDGFLLPYHEALEKSKDGEAFDPAEVVAFTPADRFEEFSYGTEHVSDDAAIEALLAIRAALSRSAELFGADIRNQEAWIDKELGRLWRKRGPFPGMGMVLHATGVPMGNLIASQLGEQAEENDTSPWSVWFSLLDSPSDYLQPALAKCIDSTTAMAWKAMPDERRKFLELLSRVDLSYEHAKVLAIPEERRAMGDDSEDADFIANPYLLYESTRLSTSPVSLGAVDRGFFPATSIRQKSPIPEPSRVDSPVDARRLRALSIRELEAAAIQGDTLVQRENIVVKLRGHDQVDDVSQTLVTGDLLKVAEDACFSGEVRVVEMGDGKPAYQLERLGKAGVLISKTVKRRIRAPRHNLVVDWRRELDSDRALGPLPTDSVEEREEEDRARKEKAEALNEIANARFSVLTGSAGTGKTTLLSVLCSRPEIKKGGIILLAPTGKARVRMEDAARGAGIDNLRAYTLAQFLIQSGRYDGATQRYMLTGRPGENVGRTVIVDECSMLTEEMLAALLESLKGVHRLILVGDHRQLPPIGAGRPFVDIITYLKSQESISGFPRVGRSYAELIVPRRYDQDGPEKAAHERDDLELADWFGNEPGPNHDSVFEIVSGHRQSETIKVETWDTADELEDIIPRVLKECLDFDEEQDEVLEFSKSLGGNISGQYAYFNIGRSGAEAERWQILSPFRQKPWGVESLNRLIHRQYKSQQIESATNVPRFSKRRFLRPQSDQLIVYGDKVINNRNTPLPKRRTYPPSEGYLANGEIGVVVGQMRTREFDYTPDHLEVEFSTQQGSVVKFWPSHFDEEGEASLELAYALTIHKAQGSEFGIVVLVLPKSSHMLTRELIYTALTRQKQKVVILMQGGTPADILRLSSEEYSGTAIRLTNLFTPPTPVKVGKKFLEEKLIHRTARGELVRSKSEVIIANLLYANGVDYQYEAPLEVDKLTKYPDFTIEDDDTGETYYWEHLGMLSDYNYRQRWNKKLMWYREQGILPREEGSGPHGTLITTEDSDNGGIDSEAVSQIITALFN